MPDVGCFVRIEGKGPNSSPADLVGADVGSHDCGKHEAVYGRSIPSFSQQSRGADQHLNETFLKKIGDQLHESRIGRPLEGDAEISVVVRQWFSDQ